METFIDKDNRIQAYMIGVYTDLDGFKCFYKLPRDISKEDGSKASSVSLDFIKYVSQSKFKNYSFFAHNFARFDFVFIVNAICELLNTNDVKIRSNHMRILSVSVNSIKFVDSLNYIPMTLNEAGVAFKEEKKELQAINIARIFTDTLNSLLMVEVIKYNKQDCQMLFKILNNLQSISISKFSLNILKSYQ